MLKIDISESSSNDDPLRKELLWETREESLIEAWCALAIKKSTDHDKAATQFKRLNKIWGLSSLLCNIAFAGLSQLENIPDFAPTVGFITTGALVAVCTFFEFGTKYQQHSDYCNKYQEFTNSLKVELCKPKSHRIACDVFLAKNQSRLNSLNRSAPDL